jgi:hypothetical protein
VPFNISFCPFYPSCPFCPLSIISHAALFFLGLLPYSISKPCMPPNFRDYQGCPNHVPHAVMQPHFSLLCTNIAGSETNYEDLGMLAFGCIAWLLGARRNSIPLRISQLLLVVSPFRFFCSILLQACPGGDAITGKTSQSSS